ncbi:leucine-rich repeat, cysteine-containing subtype protein [Tanacetum coccineum]|uniref:Leucine-rich repeat, cysteine-containing subtype protein n=1 Tax=Tanacetum coccineum TaxID=301880 RepID=A0ABQ5IVZ3_9ASTR
MTNNNNNNETTPASSSHKLGLVVGTDSGRFLRRSASLSLNSTSYNVLDNVGDKSSRKLKAAAVKLENKEENGEVSGGSTSYNVVEKSSRKRTPAAVKLENKDVVHGSGLNVSEMVVSDVKVSMEVDTTGVLASDMDTKQPDKNETESVMDDKEAEGDVGSKSLNLLSGGNKVVLIPDLNQLADYDKLSPAAIKDEKETRDRVSEEGSVGIGEKRKRRILEVDSSSSDSDGPDNMDEDFVLGNGTRIGLEEKGKEKVVEVDSSSRPRDPNEELDVGFMDDGTIAAADAGILAIGRASTSSSRMKERFKNAAKKNATRFAYFSHQQEEEDLDWPGPFSTAMKIINGRTANMPPQKERKVELVPLIWVPKEKQQRLRSDEAVAAYLEACGAPLREPSLNHVNKITNVFTEGHSNEGVKIIGFVESQILKNIEAVELLPLRRVWLSMVFDMDVYIQSSLVTMYAQSGETLDSEQSFGGIVDGNVVTWTAMVAAYVQNGLLDKGLVTFVEMLGSGTKPNVVTLVSVLPACASLELLNLGMLVRGLGVKLGG